ncbi:short-chain dehydrogenase/reductase SDR [Hyaloraphidium curvatum]|nr:short-chain dehydrogenase/reductase SDR [Hyaloraphidium curvatum]
MSLKGKAAIVTGSATGVGAATALLLASKGCNVVVNYTKSKKEADETLAACLAKGASAVLVQADVSSDADCRRLAQACVDAFGRIDFLVNNAGTTIFADHKNLDALSKEDFSKMTEINVAGPFQMIRACLPHLKKNGKNGGSVVNVSSIAGVTAIGSSVAYAASKAALNNLTMSLARALGPEIRVNAVCPGFINTRWLLEGRGEKWFNAAIKFQETTTPLQHATTPEDVADSIVWLLEGARVVTGEILVTDAGMRLGRL